MKPKSEMTEEEKQAKKEAKRKAKQLQKEFDAQFEKAMLEVREKHHDGENGIKDLDAKLILHLFTLTASLHKCALITFYCLYYISQT